MASGKAPSPIGSEQRGRQAEALETNCFSETEPVIVQYKSFRYCVCVVLIFDWLRGIYQSRAHLELLQCLDMVPLNISLL